MFNVCYLGHPNKPLQWETGPGFSQKHTASYKELDQAWEHFLQTANSCMMFGDMALYQDNELLSYTFEHPNYRKPDWDEFDRYRLRVTSSMPHKFKVKLVEELKFGKRHMRSF